MSYRRTLPVVSMDESEDTLRSLAVHDEKVVSSVLASGLETPDAFGIDAKTYALVRLGVLICLDAPIASYQSSVSLALAAGATTSDIVDTLKAIAVMVGGPRVVAAAPAIALAIGYDIDAALEGRHPVTREV